MPERKQSFPPILDAHVRLLVLGSLPGDRSLAAGRYYAHPQNQFWHLISAAINRDITALDYPDRLTELLAAHVGLWDVVASATRRGSSDAAIRDVQGHDIARLAEQLPDLRAIAFNGATAFRHGTRALGAGAACYTLVALPSSSPLHTIGIAAKLPAWRDLEKQLL